jgi:hypothetical protein
MKMKKSKIRKWFAKQHVNCQEAVFDALSPEGKLELARWQRLYTQHNVHQMHHDVANKVYLEITGKPLRDWLRLGLA